MEAHVQMDRQDFSFSGCLMVLKVLVQKFVDLFDIDFKGCRSCMTCKYGPLKGKGICGLKDGLTPLLEEIRSADAVCFGSPIYFGQMTGVAREFYERLLYPYFKYENMADTCFPRKIKSAIVYSMGAPKEADALYGPGQENDRKQFARTFGDCKLLKCHTSNGSGKVPTWSPQCRKEMLEIGLKNHSAEAYEIGKWLAQ